ncbi:DUF805 domain-containing protein [Pseudokineococcus sp. 1T1Z-3]|uniref:DUF805 domain-containing protein n=1 Tax=Pseudokineococcus sp. 1T1Z-3 TaxID=3132745 RepID=UPI0030B615DF
MSPIQAVSSVFRHYAAFSGRARRSEYWWFWLFRGVVLVLAAAADAMVFDTSWDLRPEVNFTAATADEAFYITGVVTLALLLPTIAVEVRRLHDTDRTGWWWLLNLVPFGTVVLWLFFYTRDSREPNRFGPPTKVAAQTR